MKASLNKICKSFYINLDRRQDRRDHIESTLPFLCERSPAVDGQSLELNPLVKKIFSNLDKITKAEAACAMSHYMIWKTLLNDESSDNYLILEDDVVFEKGFTTFWNHGQSLLLPKDYSLIYLGGCQPWNKPQYHKCLERYNDCFNRIKKTDFFQPDSHYWHMNASSYILSKKGAKVLCDFVDKNGFTLSLDHFMIYIINDHDSDSLYHLNPLVARQLHEENENTGEDAGSDIRKNTTKFEESKKIAYFCPSVLKHKGTTYTLLRTEERFRYKMPDGSFCKDYSYTHNLETEPFYITHDGWGINFFEAKSWYSLKIDNKLFECKVYINDRLAPRSSFKDLCNSGIGKIEDVRIIENTVVENDKSITCLACCSYFVDIEKLPEPNLGHKSSCYPGFCEVDFTNKTIKVLGYIGEDKIPEYGRTQKNWMPFKHNDSFYCIYSTDPLIYSKAENLKDIYFEHSDLTVKPDIHNATTPINIGDNTYCMVLHSPRTLVENYSWSYKKYLLKFEIIEGKITNLQKELLPDIPDHTYCSSIFLDGDGSLNVGLGIEDCDYDILKIKEPSFNYLNVIWQGIGGKTKRPWDDPDQNFIIETDWLLYLLGDIKLNHINDDSHSVAQDNSIVIYSDAWPTTNKDNNLKIKNYFDKFKDFKNCYLIHLSDEHCLAETSHYKYFKHVFRNIYRDDIADKNVTFFPLGYKSKEIKKTEEQLIPKKIHQTWETKNITPGIQSYIDKLKNLNPDFDHELYDKDDRETFLKEHFDDKVFQAYSRIVPGAMKTDLWRYCLLYKYGGIFSDIDLDYISPLSEVINGFSFVCPIDLDNDFNSPHQALNGFLCSSPGHPILKHCIDLVVSNVIDGDWDPLEHHCLDLSGPGALGMSVNFFMGREKRSPLNPMFGEHEISNYKIKLVKTINDTVKDIDETSILSCNKGPGTDLEKAYKELSKQDNVISWAENNFSATEMVEPSKEIPKVIVQACGNEILLNDSNYEYSCYNKEDCVEFLYKYFNELVLDTFNSLDSELEKSNFFKHCYLYIKGGSYIDSSPPGLSTHLSEIESIIRSTNE